MTKVWKNIVGNGGAGSQSVNPSTGAQRTEVTNQERFGAVKNSLEDSTNLAATTHYFPGSDGKSMFGFKDLSLINKLIVSSGTGTWTVEGINDEDLASGDWVPALYGYRADTHVWVNQIAVTNGTVVSAWDFDNFNYDRYRLKLVLTSATNTVIAKERVKP